MEEAHFFFNGVDATTGAYLLPPLSAQDVSRMARGERVDPAHLDELRWRHARMSEATFGLAEGLEPRDLSDAGWGVVVAADADEGLLKALRPLLDHRREQATRRHEGRYRELSGELGYRPGETKQAFLARNGAGPGPVDPDRLPYYLLLVGDPEAIPYHVQYQLDVQHAVGRLCFETLDEYARYAAAVVTAETRPAEGDASAAFFAPTNPGDRATALSAAELVAPLADGLAADHPDWKVRSSVGDAADKARLLDLLGGASTPSLLFTATHGVGFPAGHPTQRRCQGALVCQEWQGPGEALGGDTYVSADDIGEQAALQGLIAFHFACFGAGTPAWDDYAHSDEGARRRLTPEAFVAALPQRLLGHERGGALAVVGHVERAWGYSFVWPGAGRQTEVFRSSVERLLDGHPIGSAFEYFNERYAELAADLSVALEDIKYGKRPDHAALATMWTANNDARGFAILGDPAVQLRTGAAATTATQDTEAVVAATMASQRSTAPEPDPAAAANRQPAVATPESDLAEIDYGLLDGLRQTRERLTVAVQHLAETLADVLERSAESVAVVEVATYTSDDPSTAVYDRSSKRFEGAQLRVLSRASVGGNVQLIVDQRDAPDETLWGFHVAMLEQAQRTRTELLRNVGTAVTGLLDALRPG